MKDTIYGRFFCVTRDNRLTTKCSCFSLECVLYSINCCDHLKWTNCSINFYTISNSIQRKSQILGVVIGIWEVMCDREHVYFHYLVHSGNIILLFIYQHFGSPLSILKEVNQYIFKRKLFRESLFFLHHGEITSIKSVSGINSLHTLFL